MIVAQITVQLRFTEYFTPTSNPQIIITKFRPDRFRHQIMENPIVNLEFLEIK